MVFINFIENELDFPKVEHLRCILLIGLDEFLLVDEAVIVMIQLPEYIADFFALLLVYFTENKVTFNYRYKIILPLNRINIT